MIPAGCPAHRPDEQSHPPPTTNSVGADDPVAVPKISTLPYGGRWKF